METLSLVKISFLIISLSTFTYCEATFNPSINTCEPCQNQNSENEEFLYDTFPINFTWGLGAAAYQIEGAWNESGKLPSIWDTFVHQIPSPINNGATADVSTNSYYQYTDDIAALKSIGASTYRFSISWSRILPLGSLELINQSGLDYYNNLINELVQNNITPFVTMYHWDLPQSLQSIEGGWSNPDLIQHYVNYAQLLFATYGDRVRIWTTFNGPWVICWLGYGNGVYAPGIIDPPETPYLCGHNILKAHALTYAMYQNQFKSIQDGKIGIAFDVKWYEPASDSMQDLEASERALQFKLGWFASPLIHGKYPDIMRQLIDEKSIQEGRNNSRLPILDLIWSNIIQNSWDFIGLSHYTTDLVVSYENPNGSPGWGNDQNTYTSQNSSWTGTGSFWLKVVPWGFRKLLNWIKSEYNNPLIMITENGMSDAPQDNSGAEQELNDVTRIYYYRCYINNLLKAIKMDGVNVMGYIGWTLMDNFEWQAGFTEKFGLFHVNFTNPSLPRIPKLSTNVLSQIFKDNGFIQEESCKVR